MTSRTASLLGLLLLQVATPAAVPAAIFTVTSTVDAPDATPDGICATAADPPVCTLRAAVQEANRAADADVINVPAGKFTLKREGAGEDGAATGDLDLLFETTINGAGAGKKGTAIFGKKDRVFHVLSATPATFRDLVIAKGKSGTKNDDDFAFAGGGILSEGALTLERVVVSGNASSHEGGGIAAVEGTLTLTDVTISKNKALDDGGGIEMIDVLASFTRVTIAKNKASDEGGGLHVVFESDATLENCTISGNTSVEQGGGIRIESGGTVLLTNVTIAGNKAKEGGGGVDPSDDAGTVTFRNTVLDKNKPANCGGPVTLAGANLESGDSCGLSPAETNLKLKLAGLKDNGGPTPTHALKKDSPAIDFGNDANCPPADQRGQTRVDVPGIGPRICDSGAFEFVPAP
jgi:CSLREA domain-containing protein